MSIRITKKIRTYRNWMRDVKERLVHIEDKTNKIIKSDNKLEDTIISLQREYKNLAFKEKLLSETFEEYIVEDAKRMEDHRRRLVHIEDKDKEILSYIRSNGFANINKKTNTTTYLSTFPDSIRSGRYPLFERNLSYFIGRNSDNNIKDYTRLLALTMNIEKILSDEVPGAFAELGVYKGSNAAFMARYAEENNRQMYMLDTFEGFDEKDFEDIDVERNIKFEDTSLEAVKEFCGQSEAISYIKGYFPDSVTEELKNEIFAFVSLDCDLYKPILAGLEFFYPRMSNGGMIFIHDYSSGLYEGCTKAVNEFCNRNDLKVVLIPDKSGTAVLIK